MCNVVISVIQSKLQPTWWFILPHPPPFPSLQAWPKHSKHIYSTGAACHCSINRPSMCYAHKQWARLSHVCILYPTFQCLLKLATTCTYMYTVWPRWLHTYVYMHVRMYACVNVCTVGVLFHPIMCHAHCSTLYDQGYSVRKIAVLIAKNWKGRYCNSSCLGEGIHTYTVEWMFTVLHIWTRETQHMNVWQYFIKGCS